MVLMSAGLALDRKPREAIMAALPPWLRSALPGQQPAGRVVAGRTLVTAGTAA